MAMSSNEWSSDGKACRREVTAQHRAAQLGYSNARWREPLAWPRSVKQALGKAQRGIGTAKPCQPKHGRSNARH